MIETDTSALGEIFGSRLQDRLISNTLVQLVAPATRVVLGLVLTAALARYLGVLGFGAYALIFAYVAIFEGVFGDWGLGTIVLREISRRPEERASVLASAAALQLIASASAYALMMAGLALVPIPSDVREGVVVYGLVLFLGPLGLLSLPFQADLRLTKLLAPSLLGVGLHFSLSLIMVAVGGPIVALVAAAMVARVAASVWVLGLSLRAVQYTRPPTTVHWRYLLSEAWPLGVRTVVSAALQQAPTLALTTFSMAAVGLFSAAWRIPQQITLLPLALQASAFPLLARSWVADRGQFRRILEILVVGSILLSMPLAILGVGLAPPIIRTIFGPEFENAAVPFALLLTATTVMFPTILLSESLNAAGFQRVNLVVQTVATLSLITLLALLVPSGGATGAALAVLCAYLLLALTTLLGARWRLREAAPRRILLPTAVAASTGAGLLALLSSFGPVVAGALASASSVAIMLAMRADLVHDLWEYGSRRARRPHQDPRSGVGM